MARQVERRREERADDADKWTDDERKALTKLGGLFDKWNKRRGSAELGKKKEKSFLEELGISL